MANLPFSTRSELYTFVQDHMAEGTVLVVGSGLSAAVGLPTMGDLERELRAQVSPGRDANWGIVLEHLNTGVGLEAALLQVTLDESTLSQVVEITAKLVRKLERITFQKYLGPAERLPLARLLEHLFKAARQFHCITPNYDRLVELAGESIGIGVDTGFCGTYFGSYDRSRASNQHRRIAQTGRQPVVEQLPTLKVHKPHGSLDWYMMGNAVIRCEIGEPVAPLIVTPGVGKYQQGFRPIFEEQRTSGNQAIDRAKRFLILGYGFNDDHLQQYLCPDRRLTKPSIILTKHLSDSAREVIARSIGTDAVGIHQDASDDSGSEVLGPSGFAMKIETPIWKLSTLIDEVLL